MTQTLERLLHIADGETFDEFIIEGVIGEGLSKSAIAFGTTDSDTIIKLYTAPISNDFGVKVRFEKFKNEPILLELMHDSRYVVTVKTAFREHSTHNEVRKLAPYYAMERMDGSIDEIIVKPDLTLAGRLEIAVQIIKGLRDCHLQNVFHRDLYSPNILYRYDGSSYQCKISDFGSGKQHGNPQALQYFSPTGYIEITSPEAIAGLLGGDDAELEVMAAADVFSAGLMLYEIFTGLRQESVNITLAGLHQLAIRQGVYAPNIPNEQRFNFLNVTMMPHLLRVRVDPVTVSDILTSEVVAQQIMDLILSMIQFDYTKRQTNLDEIIEILEGIS